MIKEERFRQGHFIRFELREGAHTFTMCICNRRGTRSGLCWECRLEALERGYFKSKEKWSQSKKEELKG